MMNLLDGLNAIHEAGLVHNDIKPANILKFHERIDGEERDNLRITDFGIAKVLEAIGVPTDDASGFTTYFMSPEQVDHKYSKMGDVYSMGATLYHMLTGEYPIDLPKDKQDDLQAWQAAHREQPRPDARSKNPFCPPRLALLIMRMMSVNPGDRPSLERCIEDLRTIIALSHGQLFEFRPPESLQKALDANSFPIHSLSEFRGIFKPEVHTACGTMLYVLRLKMRHPVLEQYKWLVRCVSRQFADSFCMYETWGSYDINMFVWSNGPEIDKLVRNLSQQFPGSEPQYAEVTKIHHFHEKNRSLPDVPTAVLALAVQEGVPIAGLDPQSYLVSAYPAEMPERSVRAFTYVEAVEDVNSNFFRLAIAEQVRNRLHELWQKRHDDFHRLSMLELAPNSVSSRLNSTVVVVDFVASEYRYLPDVPTTIIESLGDSAVRTLTCLETRRIMIQSDRILM
jgi:protein kinase-like protein